MMTPVGIEHSTYNQLRLFKMNERTVLANGNYMYVE